MAMDTHPRTRLAGPRRRALLRRNRAPAISMIRGWSERRRRRVYSWLLIGVTALVAISMAIPYCAGAPAPPGF